MRIGKEQLAAIDRRIEEHANSPPEVLLMDCADINEQLDQLQAARHGDQEHQRCGSCQRVAEFGVVNPSDKPKKRAHTGDVIEINPADWWGRANKLALEMGSDAIRDLVSRREQLVTPDGANGSMSTTACWSAPSNQKIVLELLEQGTTEHRRCDVDPGVYRVDRCTG